MWVAQNYVVFQQYSTGLATKSQIRNIFKVDFDKLRLFIWAIFKVSQYQLIDCSILAKVKFENV